VPEKQNVLNREAMLCRNMLNREEAMLCRNLISPEFM
jgi:hypothetical protein